MSSETTKTFFSCFKKRPGISGTLACLPSVARPCRAAKVTSVKTIRFFMKQAAKLVKDDPKVKVLHLLRDPRGTLRSQASVAEFKWNDLNNASRLFCDRVYRDLQEAERLKTLFPGRVLTARYEDLATDPMAFAEKLLTFAGLTFSPKLRDYVWKITSSGLSDGGARSTVRNNSQATANSWRKKVAFSDSSVIDTNCLEVYKRTGYLAFPMEVFLKNLTFPSFVDHKRVPGLWT
ncbi:hypothetical protein BaRGS_00016048 [Batillaria attramentaria]|uniref:Uncharacterized protein n=1 Tax=Batillaria attramentaria TaxID=370345 RepID=A0ABD0KZR1_9CAEN